MKLDDRDIELNLPESPSTTHFYHSSTRSKSHIPFITRLQDKLAFVVISLFVILSVGIVGGTAIYNLLKLLPSKHSSPSTFSGTFHIHYEQVDKPDTRYESEWIAIDIQSLVPIDWKTLMSFPIRRFSFNPEESNGIILAVHPDNVLDARHILLKKGLVEGASVYSEYIPMNCPAMIRITCDNAYTLFVNGKTIGSGGNWQEIQEYQVPLCKDDIISIKAMNAEGAEGNPSGLIAEVITKDFDVIRTNSAWKAIEGYRDHVSPSEAESWPSAREYGSHLDAPWYDIGMSSRATKWIWTQSGNTFSQQQVTLAYVISQ
jgi:hypothetical protein